MKLVLIIVYFLDTSAPLTTILWGRIE